MLTGNGRVAILRTAAAEKPVRELVSQSQTSHEIAASLGLQSCPQLSDAWRIFCENWPCAIL